tara:strand:- start:197 stop:385 length:189 start_codon:yes stop_codon:yes gene_type:complete
VEEVAVEVASVVSVAAEALLADSEAVVVVVAVLVVAVVVVKYSLTGKELPGKTIVQADSSLA